MERPPVSVIGALRGIRVADFSRVLAGPLCTMILGDLGADVVKIERPGSGDETRGWGPPFVGELSTYFVSVNRNKQSIALNLDDPDDRAVARRLVERSHVVVENFRPGVMERFGLGYADLEPGNPALVYCSIGGFPPGQEDRPAYDVLIQAMSGLMSLTGPEGGPPTKVGVALVDVIAGLNAAIGIVAALRSREVNGRGQRVAVNLFDASVAALVNQASAYLGAGVVPAPMGNAHPSIVPYQTFEASDRPLVVAAANDRFFERLCAVVAVPRLASDERFRTNADRVRNRAELIAALQSAFRTRPADEWLDALQAAGVPAGPVRTLAEVFDSSEGAPMALRLEHPTAGPVPSAADPLELSGNPVTYRRPPPLLGEHSDEIRRELEGPQRS
jgi:crotonobetainyl-CoA:carnitine CoA-transferase CaiB-like acyl-CoA transferase